jgi:uncharacterized protein
MTHGHRVLLKCARLVHVYLTMSGCLLILFFAVTGFMLNHEDWFLSDQEEESVSTGVLPTDWLGSSIDKLAIVEMLRKEFAVSGAMNTFEDSDDKELRVTFKGPGREDEAIIQRDNGQTKVAHKFKGWTAILTDLHKGKETGAVWKLLIDAVCVLLLIVSITGLILWQSLRGRGRYGLVCMGLGLALSVGIYYAFVP